jgi:hypothetical protein
MLGFINKKHRVLPSKNVGIYNKNMQRCIIQKCIDEILGRTHRLCIKEKHEDQRLIIREKCKDK